MSVSHQTILHSLRNMGWGRDMGRGNMGGNRSPGRIWSRYKGYFFAPTRLPTHLPKHRWVEMNGSYLIT